MTRRVAIALLGFVLFVPLSPLAASVDDAAIEEVKVISHGVSYSENQLSEQARLTRPEISTILSTLNHLPGVIVAEGDSYGFDDWSTTIQVRGYLSSQGRQQIGTTIDGLPNGGSVYGGGARANRFVDPANVARVEVIQGTSKVSTKTLEALGGNINFDTDDPKDTALWHVATNWGSSEARRWYLRLDTGRFWNDTTTAWISASEQRASDWVNSAAQNLRQHASAKVVSELGSVRVTALAVYDEVHEDNYQAVSLDDFARDKESDGLLDYWGGIPWINQVYRQTWSTLRNHTFAYMRVESEGFGGLADNNLDWRFTGYIHDLRGRGDFAPPFMVDVTDDGLDGHSEILSATTVKGGSALGRIYFVGGSGRSEAPLSDCQSTLRFPYGGSPPEFDPTCYGTDAIPVQSYRHDHYLRNRTGITGDLVFRLDIPLEHVIRTGIWTEQLKKNERRDWHRLVDARVGPDYMEQPYWIQDNADYRLDTLHAYLLGSFSFSDLQTSIGLRTFQVDATEHDRFDSALNDELSDDLGLLVSLGAVYSVPVLDIELFGNYSENAKPLTDEVLENNAGFVDPDLEGEQSKTYELGIRGRVFELNYSLTAFQNQLNNSLEFFGPQQAGTIPDYEIPLDGRFDNVGSIDARGIEILLTGGITESTHLYFSYSYLDSTYEGTSLGPEADRVLGFQAGNSVVAVPKNMASILLRWQKAAWDVGVSYKYTGERFVDRGNTATTKSFGLTDAYVRWQLDGFPKKVERASIGLVINNLFNERYIAGINGPGGWIGPPRSAVLSLEFFF